MIECAGCGRRVCHAGSPRGTERPFAAAVDGEYFALRPSLPVGVAAERLNLIVAEPA